MISPPFACYIGNCLYLIVTTKVCKKIFTLYKFIVLFTYSISIPNLSDPLCKQIMSLTKSTVNILNFGSVSSAPDSTCWVSLAGACVWLEFLRLASRRHSCCIPRFKRCTPAPSSSPPSHLSGIESSPPVTRRNGFNPTSNGPNACWGKSLPPGISDTFTGSNVGYRKQSTFCTWTYYVQPCMSLNVCVCVCLAWIRESDNLSSFCGSWGWGECFWPCQDAV